MNSVFLMKSLTASSSRSSRRQRTSKSLVTGKEKSMGKWRGESSESSVVVGFERMQRGIEADKKTSRTRETVKEKLRRR